MKIRSIIGFLLGVSLPVFSQGVKTVSGTYTYVIPETQSYAEAQETAIQRAQLQILSDTYGTTLDMSATTSITDEGTHFQTLSQSRVKGEWLETVGEPKITRLFDGEQLAIRVEIKGKVREITTSETDFTAKVLCGVPDIRFEQNSFRNGDDFYLFFQSPSDGFLAVYLYDGKDTVYCLLPYQRQGNGSFSVKGNQPYMLFSPNHADENTPRNWIDEYTMTTTSNMEINRVYVIYSVNPFTKALDNGTSSGVPRELSLSDFQKWLSRLRVGDRAVLVKTTDITIKATK